MRKARAKRSPDDDAAAAPASTMSGPNAAGPGDYHHHKPVDAAAGGADQYKYYHPHYAGDAPPSANHLHLDSTPVHELSQTSEAQELPADNGPGYHAR